MDITSCKKAVYDIQNIRPNAYLYGENGVTYINQPKGCYLDTNGSGNAIKFNKHFIGYNKVGSTTGRQICIPNKGIHKPYVD